MAFDQNSLVGRLRQWPDSRPASRRPLEWDDEPVLCRFASAGSAALTAARDDRVFAVLAGRAAADELAAMAALSALARVLGPVVGGWQRAGLRGDDLAEAEAGLVFDAYRLMLERPDSGAAAVAQAAWHAAHGRRRRDRGLAARQVCSVPDLVDRSADPAEMATALVVVDGWVADGWSVPAGGDRAKRSRRFRARRALRLALDGGAVSSGRDLTGGQAAVGSDGLEVAV